MASEVVYAEVSPKERVHFISQTSETGNPPTYGMVKVKRRSDRPDSTPKTATSVENLHWRYIAVILYLAALILLITVILMAVKCHHI